MLWLFPAPGKCGAVGVIRAAQYTDPVTYHGEGAVWSDTWGGLRCVDMLCGDVLDIPAAGDVVRHRLGSIAAMIRPCGDGLSIVAIERRVALWNERRGTIENLTGPLVGEGSRLNEGTCAPDGSLLIGSLSYDQQPGGGSLFKVGASGESHTVLPSVSISNGIGFSPGGDRAYYVDSALGTIDAFTVTGSGDLSERRTLVHIPAEDGTPDGIWVDEDGGVWAAMYGGHSVRRYLPDGRLDEVVHVPARQVTSCTFGGPDLSTLYITTSRENLADGEDLLAGSLFSADVGIRGLPVTPFHFDPTAHSQSLLERDNR